ncbi:hypothetical protein [Hymenobacter terrestris]|uniref:DUF4625 domain-containing protein n=1 Tax=Hymenobacter terrestris TaxID=2748310 RepID=A0ABX2Q5T6_9BACT|nr:hypothetical protein [Hymenobacter terrestris]NVO85336.1 hypothetical protein [Hymenobacter terrestris]
MKQLALLLLLGLGSLLHISCKKEPAAGEVLIRVKNASSYQFQSVQVIAPGGENSYGALGTGEETAYAAYPTAYKYAYVKVLIDGQEFVFQPIDYVGEAPLGPGKYAYVLSVANITQGNLTLTLEKQ